MHRLLFYFVIGLVLLVFPQQALANAGTPLLWAGMIHLAFGNAFIGVLEGWLMRKLFVCPGKNPIPMMVGANYFSAWVGGLFLNNLIFRTLPIDLNSGWVWFLVMVVLTYGMTLLLELPFVYLLLRGQPMALSRSFKASVVVQTASYVLLIGWYGMAGHVSLFTKTSVVRPMTMEFSEAAAVYFISTKNGAAYRGEPRTGRVAKIHDLHSTNRNDRLLIWPSGITSNRWDIVARLETGDSRNPNFVTILTNRTLVPALEERILNAEPRSAPGTWFNFGTAPVIGGATNRSWSYSIGFWAQSGLRVKDKRGGGFESFAFETPFGSWNVRNAVQLPDDQVIFQLGDDQICGFDPRSRNIALLFRGRGPVTVIEQ